MAKIDQTTCTKCWLHTSRKHDCSPYRFFKWVKWKIWTENFIVTKITYSEKKDCFMQICLKPWKFKELNIKDIDKTFKFNFGQQKKRKRKCTLQ